jgi:hypothetical protein
MLRNIFRTERDEVTGEQRKIHNKELSDQYSSPNIVRVIKWSIIRLAADVARMERVEVYTVLCVET